MPARHQAELELRCATPEEADLVLRAVAAELAAGPDGTTADARPLGAALRIRLEADDLAGLRAALQGALRLVDAAQRVARA